MPKPHDARRRPMMLLMALAALFVLMPFLFWQQTWFGRPLSDREIGRYLEDTGHPRKIQHALAQISDRIAARDPVVRSWYPQMVKLAGHPMAEIRTTAAWTMGQDNAAGAFHEALLGMLKDPEVMVRRNAALALVRFGDASGRPELRAMLQPHLVRAPRAGTVETQVQPGHPVGKGTLLARLSGIEVRAPLSGEARPIAADGAGVTEGEPLVAIRAEPDQVWEALRALYLVGQPDDVELIQRAASAMPDRVRRQADLTLAAIRRRSGPTPSR